MGDRADQGIDDLLKHSHEGGHGCLSLASCGATAARGVSDARAPPSALSVRIHRESAQMA